MKSILTSLFASVLFVSAASAADGWISMFNGKDLSGWKSNAATEDQPAEKAKAFTVKDGELVVEGGRAHLFYVGEKGDAKFRNFEFKAKHQARMGA